MCGVCVYADVYAVCVYVLKISHVCMCVVFVRLQMNMFSFSVCVCFTCVGKRNTYLRCQFSGADHFFR